MTHQFTWTPSTNITQHAGRPILANIEFFAAPPLEIGQVTSAESTLKTSTKLVSTPLKIIICLVSGLVGTGVTWQLTSSVWFAGIIGSLAVLIAYGKTAFFHYCSYVGEKGVATYEIKGDRLQVPKAKILRFQDTTNLYTSQTQNYVNFFYRGTSYSYRFEQKSEKPFHLYGEHRSRKGYPEDKDSWHLANAAEVAWINYLFPVVDEQVARSGYVEFPMKGYPKAVRVGPAFLEFVLEDGVVQRVQVADMRKITLGSGTFYFEHDDSPWWSNKGAYSFQYNDIPNAKLFLFYLKRLTGIEWS